MDLRKLLVAALLLAAPLAVAAPPVGPEHYPGPEKAAPAPRLKLDPASVTATEIRLAAPGADELKRAAENNRQGGRKRRQIGFSRPIPEADRAELRPEELHWTAVPSGGRAAHVRIVSAGARALRLGLTLARLPAGAELRFFGSAEPDRIYGPVGAGEALANPSRYWSPVTEGNGQTVEIYLPAGQEPAGLEWDIPELSHLVRNPFRRDDTKAIGDAELCEIDVACVANPTPALRDAANAVARLLYTDSGGTFVCTGTLLNDTDPGSLIPYLITANHCINNQTVANTVNAFWFFEAPSCGAQVASSSARQVGGGGALLFGSPELDVTFLRLNNAPPAGATFAAWDPTPIAAGAGVIDIHHPSGDLKKISSGTVLGFGPFQGQGSFITVRWSQGSTEGGSSGSGLFTLNSSFYTLRGTLFGGTADCANPNGTDSFSRFDQTYPFIKQFLDPNASLPLVSAVLPASRSVQVGATATAFATILNPSTTPGVNCRIAPATAIPAGFTYQTTNPATNGLTGTLNTPVPIPAGGSQTFVVALAPTAAFAPTDVQFAFACDNVSAATPIPGVNTLLLSGSATPVPDVIALALTPTSDGIVNIPGAGSIGAFAVATSNVGAAGAVTARADTGSATLPVSLSLCQTNPANGACLAPPAPAVAFVAGAGGTATFSVFVAGGGNVNFDPAANRVFVRFVDAGGVVRGATSVAVRTQ